MKILDLFSGAGGFSKGFEQAGFEIVTANELDHTAAETHRLNHPNCRMIEGDITNPGIKQEIIETSIAESVNIIIGGPPCQAYSISGNKDPNDPRARLFRDYVDIVKQVNPELFLLENVPGTISSKTPGGYRRIDNIISVFNAIGYTVTYKMLNAADFGVPQTRQRYILIGSKKYIISFPKATVTKYKTVREAIDDLSDMPEDRKFSHIFTKSRDEVIERIKKLSFGQSLNKFKQSNVKLYPDKPSRTICTGSGFCHYEKSRFLTPREQARLQSFPDDFLFKGCKTSVLEQIGNAVPVGLAKAIAEHLKEKNFFRDRKQFWTYELRDVDKINDAFDGLR